MKTGTLREGIDSTSLSARDNIPTASLSAPEGMRTAGILGCPARAAGAGRIERPRALRGLKEAAREGGALARAEDPARRGGGGRQPLAALSLPPAGRRPPKGEAEAAVGPFLARRDSCGVPCRSPGRPRTFPKASNASPGRSLLSSASSSAAPAGPGCGCDMMGLRRALLVVQLVASQARIHRQRSVIAPAAARDADATGGEGDA